VPNQAIEKFKEYIGNQSEDFLRNGRQVEGILRDIFPKEKFLIMPLLCTWEAGAVTELKQTSNVEQTIAQLGDRLSQEYGLRESVALTSLRVWAYALSITNVAPNIDNRSVSSRSQTDVVYETKKCPFCAQEVKKDAVKCKRCHGDISIVAIDKAVQNGKTPSGPDFKKTSVLFVIVMSIITHGIYCPMWFLTRRNTINCLQFKKKLNTKPFYFAILICATSLLLSIFSGVNEWRGKMDTAIFLYDFSESLDLFVWIILLFQSLKVRRILHKHFKDHLEMNLRFSWLVTFFLQIIYLQYKMNRLSSTNIIPIEPQNKTNFLLKNKNNHEKGIF